MEALDLSFLGTATSDVQLQRTLGFVCVWATLDTVAEKLAPNSLADNDDRRRFGGRISSLVHAMTTSALSISIMLSPEESVNINQDHMYGFSDRANLLFSVACGYFLYDLWVCLTSSKMDYGFLLHAIACLLCYTFGQFPYLHYYGVRFLLFELSTPFLNVMLLLRQFGRMGPLHDAVQSMFGYSFLGVRILYGFPLSYAFFEESVNLLTNGKPHSVGVVVYYLVANCALNSLNLFWLISMMSKRRKSS